MRGYMAKKKKEQVLAKFIPPICKECGFYGLIQLNDDGACGDPDCCVSPIFHIEISCTNKDCKNFFGYEMIAGY